MAIDRFESWEGLRPIQPTAITLRDISAVDYQVHNLEAAGSIPAPATLAVNRLNWFGNCAGMVHRHNRLQAEVI